MVKSGILLLIAALLAPSLYAQVITLGRSSNAYSGVATQANQIYTDSASNLVVFIHRQDISIHGGTTADNGRLRYDISTDGGLTFTNDVGILNSVYTLPGRHPQIVGYNPTATTDPLQTNLVWSGATLGSTDLDGYVTGFSTVSTSAPGTSEHYSFAGQNTFTGGGLCEGLSGEFWQVDHGFTADSIFIYKGVYNAGSQDVDWSQFSKTPVNLNTAVAPTGHMNNPNMSFSPDGSTGWVGFLGDLTGGIDEVFAPVLMSTTDGGATWSAPIEIDLSTVPFIGDNSRGMALELQAFAELDTASSMIGSGIPTCLFDFDITVDANGNPHLFTVVGNAGSTPYTSDDAAAKLAVDITSDDGGATWKAIKISSVYTHQGAMGAPNSIAILNYAQVSRTPGGDKIFYSWVDSDTTIVGFGVSENSYPDLRIAGYDINTGLVTCPKWITKDDFQWGGRVLLPTMAPEILEDGNGNYQLPIVFLGMISNDPLEPCEYYYAGNNAVLSDADFVGTPAGWNSETCAADMSVGLPEFPGIATATFPNPFHNRLVLEWDDLNTDLVLNAFAMDGRLVLRQQLTGNRTELNTADWTPGIYLLELMGSNQHKTLKVVKE